MRLIFTICNSFVEQINSALILVISLRKYKFLDQSIRSWNIIIIIFSFGTLFVRKCYVMQSKVYSTLSWYLNEVLDMGGSFYKGTREYLGKEFKSDQLMLA